MVGLLVAGTSTSSKEIAAPPLQGMTAHAPVMGRQCRPLVSRARWSVVPMIDGPENTTSRHEPSKQVLSPVSAAGPGGPGAGFMKAPVLAEVSLAQGGAAFSGSPRAVALAAGTLDPTPKELVRSMTKQVLHATPILFAHTAIMVPVVCCIRASVSLPPSAHESQW